MTRIFADGADLRTMIELAHDDRVSGFTTNPSLMRKAGIANYREFAFQILAAIPDKPISFEVLADDVDTMETQAREIANWGGNVVVKIPITNTRRESTLPVVRRLSEIGVTVNVTAIMIPSQVLAAAAAIGDHSGYVSIFAGRIADTGWDPIPYVMESLEILSDCAGGIKLIWASPREVLNYYQATKIGCHIITMTPDLIRKLSLQDKDLEEYSLETVRMFYEDGKKAFGESAFA